MTQVDFSVGGSSGLGWQDFVDITQACDELGFYGFYPSDHLMQVQQGRGPATDRLDSITTMAALAGHTQRLKLGVLVVNNLFRHPVITAKMFNTLDHASGGRAELGLGGGWSKPEHVAHGMPFPPFAERIARLDEALQLIKALWAQEVTTFHGAYYSVDEAPFLPRPVQQPHPPIIVGGTGETTMRVIARHANEWNQIASHRDVEANIERMRAVCAEQGRSLDDLRLSVQLPIIPTDSRKEAERHVQRAASLIGHTTMNKVSPQYANVEEQARDGLLVGDAAELQRQVGRWVDLGVRHFILLTPRPFNRRVLETLANDVLPAFRG